MAPKHGIIGHDFFKARGAQLNKNELKSAQDVWDVQHKELLPIKSNALRFRIDAREHEALDTMVNSIVDLWNQLL